MRQMRLLAVLVIALACAGCVVPQQRYDDLNNEKLLIDAKCVDLTRAREKLAAEKASLDATIARGGRDIAKHEQRVKDLRESNIELMREVKDARKKAAESEKKAGELDAARAKWAEEKKHLDRKCERIENERVTVQRQYRDLLEQHSQLQRRLSEAPPPEAPAPAGGGAAQGGQGLDVSGTDG